MRNKLVLLIVIAVFASSHDSFCQRVKKRKIENASSVNHEENRLINSLYFPNNKLSWGKMDHDKNNISIAYSFVNSIQTINILSSSTEFYKWTNKEINYDYNGNHIYYSGIIPIVNRKERFPYFMFYGDSVLNYISMKNKDLSLTKSKELSVMLGCRNSAIGLISDSKQVYSLIINTEDSMGDSSVIGLISEDGGGSWGSPSVVVKNNLISLKAWTIACKTKNPESGYMTFTDSNNIPYYSHTGDAGKTWSYPKELNSLQAGDGYKMIIYREYAVVVYRNLEKGNDYNDIMLWHGKMTEFVSDQKKGNTMKIADNDSYDSTSNYYIEDITSYKRKESFILLKNYDGINTTLQLRKIAKW